MVVCSPPCSPQIQNRRGCDRTRDRPPNMSQHRHIQESGDDVTRLAHSDRLTGINSIVQDPHPHRISWYTPWLPPSIAVLLRPHAMRPLAFFFTLFSFFLVAALVAARTESISSRDGRLSYQGNWRYVSLRGTWVARSTLIFHPPSLNLLKKVDSSFSGVLVQQL
jgi:hypothetical protein